MRSTVDFLLGDWLRVTELTARPRFAEFTADGTGWRNASLGDCLPGVGRAAVEDVTEPAGYGWRFFCATARSPRRRALLPIFSAAVAALLVNIFERKDEARHPYVRLVDVTEDDTDPAKWGTNWPKEYDSYKLTALTTRTRFGGHGGSEGGGGSQAAADDRSARRRVRPRR